MIGIIVAVVYVIIDYVYVLMCNRRIQKLIGQTYNSAILKSE